MTAEINATIPGTVSAQVQASVVAPVNAQWGQIGGTLSNQTDLAAAINSKQDKIPTITISAAQVVSFDPITISFSGDAYADQRAIIENENISQFIISLEGSFIVQKYNMGDTTIAFEEVGISIDENEGTYTPDGFGGILFLYNLTSKLAVGNTFFIVPNEKTSAMTQPVGIDSDGRLWTAPGGSGGSTATTALLTVAGWSNNSQTVSVTGVTASNNIIVAPAPASQAAYTAAGIICTAQENGTLTFTCTTVPTAAITVNVLIVG